MNAPKRRGSIGTAKAWPALLTALVEQLGGKPIGDLDWRDVTRVRDQGDQALNRLLNDRQMPPGDAA